MHLVCSCIWCSIPPLLNDLFNICVCQGMKGHKCEVCSREFTLSANLKRHMLIHNSIRPFQCHVCFKSFIQKQTLKTHMIVHLPVKPFKCKVRSNVTPGTLIVLKWYPCFLYTIIIIRPIRCSYWSREVLRSPQTFV